jgi:cytoskeletal protein CcmA (bactofilin family)
VNATIAGLLLVLFTAGWLMLPLLPALREAHQKTDTQPLSIIPEDPFNPACLAERFAERLGEIQAQIQVCQRQGSSLAERFGSGEAYCIVGRPDELALRALQSSGRSADEVLILCRSGRLPAHMHFRSEVYAAEALIGGASSVFRAILADEDLELGAGTTVLRWVHSRSDLVVGRDCMLRGRATAHAILRLSSGTRFERLHARRVEFNFSDAAESWASAMETSGQGIGRESPKQRTVVRKDLSIPAGRFVEGDYVVYGDLRVGAGSHVRGSLKSHGDIYIEAGAIIEGSVVSARNLELGEGCEVRWPVISEGRVTIHTGCRIGTERHPTSVTAPEIVVAPGVVAFGTVWASREGYVA